jgi:hypothetical protein
MFKLLALERKSASHDKNKQQQVHIQIKTMKKKRKKIKPVGKNHQIRSPLFLLYFSCPSLSFLFYSPKDSPFRADPRDPFI